MIEAFFLGDDLPRLFVTYHPPGNSYSDEITVICPPFFGEYMRVQICLRELAIGLSSAGQHVFRFDYRSTGDSYGDAADVSLSAWADDLARVISEARDVTGCYIVNLVCVRAGSLVALTCGALQGLNKVAFWDPILDGQGYWDSLVEQQKNSMAQNRWLSRSARRYAGNEVSGNPVTERLIDEISAIKPSNYHIFDSSRCLLVTTVDVESPGQCLVKPIKFNCDWRSDDDSILIPQPVLEELHSWTLSQ